MERLSLNPEEDRRHLLSDNASIAASSIYPQDPPSQIPSPPASAAASPRPSTSNIPRRATIPQTPTPAPYRGFPSQEAYLAALRSWVEEKQYTSFDSVQLKGFYGSRTSKDYLEKPVPEFVQRIKDRKEARREGKRRRNTVANASVVGRIEEEEGATEGGTQQQLGGDGEVGGKKRFAWPRRKSVGLAGTR